MSYLVKTFAACVLAITTTATANAQSFRAENRVIVNPVPGGGFEAIEGNGSGARGMWCGAADYAQDVLGAAGTQRLYVQTVRGNSVTQPGRKGVIFGLDPAGATPSRVTSVGASINVPGANLSIDHARQFCADARLVNRR